MVNYSYKIFGLIFSSEFEFSELGQIVEGQPNITIRFGKTPANLGPNSVKNAFFEVTTSQFLMTLNGIATYFVNDGKEIVIQPFNDQIDSNTIKMFMMGMVFTVLLHQRKFWPIHASGIEINGECVAFSGKSGAGKSTLAGAFLQNGYSIVADDVCAVTYSECDDSVRVTPGIPQLKLWDDALKSLKVEGTNLRKVRAEIQKFGLPICKNFRQETIPLKRIYLLEKEFADYEITQIKGSEKIQALLNATHKPKVAFGLGINEWLFQLCNTLASKIEVRKLRHPYDGNLEKLFSLLERDMAQ